ncbi:glycoside hydrolase family 55 protein [Paenibacillus sp. YPG26]|uniref:glycoside hydrolase family 55 protein n=1 Tax=Paenibacillus sp. YPG26 TaxID=2878915 RepID=UPI00203D967C|nr:glycoside hydrolase family 55 protein [Paenibacillus sp. YPG26]USB33036.1 glycoside hydrolase family 55 protein [Paenibacillus sp. YPG26]
MKRFFKQVMLAILAMANSGDTVQQAVISQLGSPGSVINVRQIGAKGNGRDDDTPFVQKALDQAAGRGASVFFPKGSYVIDPNRTLIVGSRTKLVGQGSDSVIKASGSRFGWELMRVTGSDVEICNLSLDGNKQVNRVLVVGGGVQRVNISGVTAANASQSRNPDEEGYSEVVAGIVVYGNTSQIKIDSSEVKNIYAINQANGSMIARGIYITTTWGSNEQAARRVMITNSHIHHIGPADDGDGIYYEDPAMDENGGENTDSLISGNLLEYCAKRGMKIYAQGVKVSGNHIVNSFLNNNFYQGVNKGKLAPDMFSAVSVYGSNNIIYSNVIDGIGSFYAAIEVSAMETVRNTVISNNRIIMGSGSNIKGTTAIRLGNIHNFTIKNNTIENGERAIWTWQNADFGVIKDNTIRMSDGGGIDLSTYLDGYTQVNLALGGNRIEASTFNIQLAPTNRNVTVRA